jgi:hypothetical protein
MKIMHQERVRVGPHLRVAAADSPSVDDLARSPGVDDHNGNLVRKEW